MSQLNNKESVDNNNETGENNDENIPALVRGAIDNFYKNIARNKNGGPSLIDAANKYIKEKSEKAKQLLKEAILRVRAYLQAITDTQELIICTNFLDQIEKNILGKA